jgi:hypothetical protein
MAARQENRFSQVAGVFQFCGILQHYPIFVGFVYGPTSGSANLPKSMMALTGQGQESGVGDCGERINK